MYIVLEDRLHIKTVYFPTKNMLLRRKTVLHLMTCLVVSISCMLAMLVKFSTQIVRLEMSDLLKSIKGYI